MIDQENNVYTTDARFQVDATTNSGGNNTVIEFHTLTDIEMYNLREAVDPVKAQLIEIHQRNAQRDVDKMFESSKIRILVIMVITYITVYLYLKYTLNVDKPELNAIVPTIGFNMSTWSLSWVKAAWLRSHRVSTDSE